MSLLDAMLRPAAKLLNDSIAETTLARELCADLAGTVAVVRVRGTGLALTVRVHPDTLELASGAADEPDIAITGTPVALLRLLADREGKGIRDGSVELIGDAELAQDFQRLLASASPDLEEQLSRLAGDPAAHAAGNFARGFNRWAEDARATLGANLREFLQEEHRDVPTRYEVERFARSVDTLRDDVERLAARLDRLGERR